MAQFSLFQGAQILGEQRNLLSEGQLKVRIVADIGSNHLGNMAIAEAMVSAAAEVGVDMVKFQSWQASKLRPDFPDYQATFARHLSTELSDEDHYRLVNFCREKGVEFLTTCFDLERVDFLAGLGLRTIKVASPDCASFRLLDRLMEKFEHLIISTGMSTDEEVERMIRHTRGHKVTVLHCVSLYPTPLDKVNLERMNWLRSFGVEVGFSDHSLGVEASMLAISMGAQMVEKHFTLSRRLPGKDQAVSGTPEEFAQLVAWAALVEQMKGQAHPGMSEEELKLRALYVGKWGDNK